MENSKPKVIIIGANGMLGQALVETFKKGSKYSVLAWDREEINIADQSLVKAKIAKTGPYLIINAAAYNAVDLIEEDEVVYVGAKKINGDGPKYLAEAAKKYGAILEIGRAHV